MIKKSLCTWWLQYWKLQVMFKVSLASLQTFIDTPNCVLEDRFQHSTPSVIPNSNYVFMVSDWNCLKYFCMFFCTVIFRWTETFWSLCINSLMPITKYAVPSFDCHKFTSAWEAYVFITHNKLNPNRTINDEVAYPALILKSAKSCCNWSI
jgi:hypothetical protein